MQLPKVLKTCESLREMVREFRLAGKTVGLVPTMGALHEGHLSLVRESTQRCDETIVTIFVNPTQFAPHEDLEKYPRALQADLHSLCPLSVSAVFCPQDDARKLAGWDCRH